MNKGEIIEHLNKQPNGYISTKNIHGKTYYYLQNRINGKVTSKYIRNDEVQEITSLLNIHKQLIKELQKQTQNDRQLPVPSKSIKEYTGYLMMGDRVCASFDHGNLISLNEEICPLIIKRTKDLSSFLSLRSIDQTRINSKLLKKELKIKETKNEEISLYSYGATITDNYWFKAKGSKLNYKDICFKSDVYNDLSLNGSFVYLPKKKKYTPQLTLTGSFEKCWRLIDNDWWLYKVGTKKEIFSEIYCSLFADLIEIDTAIYEYDGKYIRTRNFADKYNFEPICSIAGDDDSYENVFNSIEMLSRPDISKDYLKLIFFDNVVNNVDRHNENLGLLRDKETGEIISLAPNFDNNVALISKDINLESNPKDDGFIKFFTSFYNQSAKSKLYFKEIKFKNLIIKDLNDMTNKIHIDIDMDLGLINKYVLNRYNYLIDYLK